MERFGEAGFAPLDVSSLLAVEKTVDVDTAAGVVAVDAAEDVVEAVVVAVVKVAAFFSSMSCFHFGMFAAGSAGSSAAFVAALRFCKSSFHWGMDEFELV